MVNLELQFLFFLYLEKKKHPGFKTELTLEYEFIIHNLMSVKENDELGLGFAADLLQSC